MTFRASDFPAEISWFCSPRVSINSLFSVMAVARHLCVSYFEQIQFPVKIFFRLKYNSWPDAIRIGCDHNGLAKSLIKNKSQTC